MGVNMKKKIHFLCLMCLLFGGTVFSTILPPIDGSEINNGGKEMPRKATGTIVEKYGRLQVYDAHVCAEDGRQISLGGMSFFWSNWASYWYTNDTVDFLIDAMNVSIIRAAHGVPEESGPTGSISALKTVVERAIYRGIYVIIDYHCEGDLIPYEAQAIDFFTEMAQLYGDTPNVIYELWNEPTDQLTSFIQNYCQNLTNAIRVYDPDNLILCGSHTWSQYPNSYTISDSNVAYTFHGYFDNPQWGYEHMQQFYTNVNATMESGNAVFISEFGAEYGDVDGTNEIIDACQELGISMCAWSVNDKKEPWSIFEDESRNLTQWGYYLQYKFEHWGGIQTEGYALTTKISGFGTITPTWGFYEIGEEVQITAIPDQGWVFMKWEGDLSGSENPISITMNSQKSIKAIFWPDDMVDFNSTDSTSDDDSSNEKVITGSGVPLYLGMIGASLILLVLNYRNKAQFK
jgi:endoglucanase